uniref:Putative ATPase domain containing protein n=1 Tax=viral metagenome TaxID=1070528 RepID=A0A6M3XNX0_9ZZZZ
MTKPPLTPDELAQGDGTTPETDYPSYSAPPQAEPSGYVPLQSPPPEPPPAPPAPPPPRPQLPYGLQLTSSREAGSRASLNILIHGPSGAGKTYLAKTTGDLEHTLVLAAEPGLLTLRDVDIPVIEVTSLGVMQSVYRWLRGGDHAFRWVILDSISEIAEQVLVEEKKTQKDGRKAYGELADRLTALIRAFRDLPVHVVMISKQARTQDDVGRMLYAPSFPGQKLSQGVAYMFDEVLALRAQEGVDADGKAVVNRYLQTAHDGTSEAKDRSGALDLVELPSLSHIAGKILGTGANA